MPFQDSFGPFLVRCQAMPIATSPKDAFRCFLVARFEILECNIKIGTPAEQFEALSHKCALAVIKNLGVVHKPSSEEQASIMQAVMAGPMLDADKRFAELQRGPIVFRICTRCPNWACFRPRPSVGFVLYLHVN